MGDARRVFISHTSELRSARVRGRSFVDAAEDAIKRSGDAVTDMAYFTASPVPPERECRSALLGSDVYVALIGFRWGSAVPDRPEVSYTELEYMIAHEFGMPRLIFMLDDHLSECVGFIDDSGTGSRQYAFRRRLKTGSRETISWVRSPEELRTQLLQALHELRRTG